MSDRKPIPKSIRFEVFKRDKFTCQYCGASAPDVILEVDHIKPVSRGGSNQIMNLLTACRDCNRGKTNKELSDNTAVMLQKKQMEAAQERREQLEMMLKWREELEAERELEIDAIDQYFSLHAKFRLNDNGKRYVRKLIKKFGFNEVYTACEISIDKYYNGSETSWEVTLDKVGGICYNRKKAGECNAE